MYCSHFVSDEIDIQKKMAKTEPIAEIPE